MNKNEFVSKVKEYTSLINESLKSNDFDGYKVAKSLLENVVKTYKEDYDLLSESKTDNFGILNYIIVENLPRLFKGNKNAVKKIMKTIKEDKNLSAQFNCYKLLEDYSDDIAEHVSPNEYVKNVINMTRKNIFSKGLLESNRKLSNILVENDIKPYEAIDEDKKQYFKSCQKMLINKTSFGNLKGIMESKSIVEKYINENKKSGLKKDNVNIYEMIDKYNDEKKLNLNEEEKDLVNQITAAKSPVAEERKERLFNNFKNECIDKINKLFEESKDEDKKGLIKLKEELTAYQFNSDTIVTDIAKLLEIRDVLMEK